MSENPLTKGIMRIRDPEAIPGERAIHYWRFLDPVRRMVVDSHDQGMPLTQEQLRIITMHALAGGR